jgi:acetate kinase
MERITEFLKALPLFESFSLADLAALVEKSRLVSFAPEEKIIHYGQPGRFLGIILEGRAEAVLTGQDGEREHLDWIEQGSFLGEMSLITGEPTVADVVALERSELLLISQKVFYESIAVDSEALRVIAKTITERLRRREEDEAAQRRVEDAWQHAPDPYGLSLSASTPMRVLSLDCSHSTLRFSYFDTADADNEFRGTIEKIGERDARLVISSSREQTREALGPLDHARALATAVDRLIDPERGILRDLGELDAIGHKVVHGGDLYGHAALLDDQVLAQIEAYARLAPRHNPLNLLAIREAMRLAPDVPQVAVFDTGYHQKMPPQAYLYGLPYELYDRDRIRKYGFQGIAHHYVALRAAAHMQRNYRECRLITCVLDEEASLAAIDHGRSIDTSMGLAPLEGLMMGTRSGDVDPSVILYLLQEKRLTVEQVDEILNHQSGLYGLSGISGDFRELEEAANQGDHRSIVTIQTFCYRIRKYIGAYLSAMGGLDALVFTGRIGVGSAWVRSLACQGVSHMGIQVDEVLNRTVPPRAEEATEISDAGSQVRILVIPTDEGRMIARQTIRALGYQGAAQVSQSRARAIPVEVSAHHVHLSREHIDALFGAGYELTVRAELSQPGQYACEEMLDLIGPRGRVERVRILGPQRGRTQVEIAMTEEFKLGIRAPIRPSGDLAGSPGITLEGPRGTLYIPEGVICSARHIHIPPEDALALGLKDRDICMIRVEGERTLIFGDVLVRVNPDYRLAMHIDTDEANAASVRTGMEGYLVSVQDRR